MSRAIQLGLMLVIAISILFIASGAAEGRSLAVNSNPVFSTKQVAGNTAFALDLYSKLKAEKGNLFFSPYSISSALAMTYAGARGTTAVEMEKVMHFASGQQVHAAFARLNESLADAQKDGSVELAIANSLWPQKGEPFRPEFMELIQKNYGSSVTSVDYSNPVEATRIINAWVEKNTKEKIKNLIDGLDPKTVLVLVNAIYFKGNWAEQFATLDTRADNFTLASGEKITARLMHQTKSFAYAETEGAQILEMPYAGNRLSMVVILPRDPSGIAKIEDQLDTKTLGSWMSLLHNPRKVNVALPKFKITWGTKDLKDAFNSLGMHAPFADADFSGMADVSLNARKIVISKILHKAFVEVNEEGTEAAAATAVIMARGGMGPKIPAFHADHPFIFLIRDKSTGQILFMGRVMDPTKS